MFNLNLWVDALHLAQVLQSVAIRIIDFFVLLSVSIPFMRFPKLREVLIEG